MPNMNKRRQPGDMGARQSGVMLLEALIAILIFSLGILTVIGIQAASIKMALDAQFRTKAVLLANRLVGEMWTNINVKGADPVGEMANKFSSPSGSEYVKWLNCHVAPNDSCSIGDFTPDPTSGLPGVSEEENTLPTVSVVTAAGWQAGRVQITLYWRTPSMEEGERHQHTVISQITRN
jgi:type IV pilus assembly protein PilV